MKLNLKIRGHVYIYGIRSITIASWMWISCFFWWPFVATHFPLPPKRATWPKTVNPLAVEICQVLSNSCAKISPKKSKKSWISVPGPYDKFHGGFEITKLHFAHQKRGSRPKCSDNWTIGQLDMWHVTMRVCVCFLRLFFFWWGEKRQKDTNGRFGTWLNLFQFVVSDVFVFDLFSVIDVCWNPVVDRYVLDRFRLYGVYRHFRRITEISTRWAQEPFIGSWFQLGVKEPQWNPFIRPFI